MHAKRFCILASSVRVRPHAQAHSTLYNESAQLDQGLRGLAVIGLQLFGLVVGDQGVDDGLQAALHDQVELVQS
jgi:hypothetical protein